MVLLFVCCIRGGRMLQSFRTPTPLTPLKCIKCTQTKGRHPQKKNYFKWALPVKLRPLPPRLNGQGGPFSGRQKRHFSAYYRIKLKSILIIKMMISVMKIVIFLMIMVMKMTKNRQIPCLLSQNIPLLGTIT